MPLPNFTGSKASHPRLLSLSLAAVVVLLSACSDSRAPVVGERTGQQVYETYCFACHNTGAVGAPRVSDLEALARLEERGMDALLKTTKSGVRAMPPKGTCIDCTDDELLKATKHLLTSYAAALNSTKD